MRIEPRSPRPGTRLTRRAALWSCAALLLLLTTGGTALAQDASPETTARVEALLSGFEHSPRPDEWTALGDEGATALLEIAADDSRLATTRARAVSALRHFPGEQTAARLEAMIDGQLEVPAILVRKSMSTLAVVAPQRALDAAPAALASSDVSTREVAVRVLIDLDTPAATDVLHAHYAIETSELVRTRIVEAVGIPAVEPVSPGPAQPGPKE